MVNQMRYVAPVALLLLVILAQNCADFDSNDTTSEQGLQIESSDNSDVSAAASESWYDRKHHAYDFMVQDVCLKSNGAIEYDKVPGDVGCEKDKRRNMRASDPITYRLHNRYPNPANQCRLRDGTLSVSNYPVIHNGQRRIVLFKDQGRKSNCSDYNGHSVFYQFDSKDYSSLRWYDADYMFLPVTESGGGLSFGMSKDYCDEYGSQHRRRFFGQWIHMPTRLPRTGTVGGIVNRSKMVMDGNPNTPCPSSNGYSYVFSMWERMNFKFHNNQSYDTIVHQKFSNGSKDLRLAQGAAKNFERIYLTDEFGVTRWEKWLRSDNLTTNELNAAKTLKANLSSVCSPPYDMPGNASPLGITTSGLYMSSSVIKEVIQDKKTGERTVWYMVSCHDFTHIKKWKNLPQSKRAFKPSAAQIISDNPSFITFF